MIERLMVTDELMRHGRSGKRSWLAMALEVRVARENSERQFPDTPGHESRFLRPYQA
jgi:hypothetical protein